MKSVVTAGRTTLAATTILLATLCPTVLAGPLGAGLTGNGGQHTDAPPASVVAADGPGSMCVACWE